MFIYSDPKALVSPQIFQRIQTTAEMKCKLLKEFTLKRVAGSRTRDRLPEYTMLRFAKRNKDYVLKHKKKDLKATLPFLF